MRCSASTWPAAMALLGAAFAVSVLADETAPKAAPAPVFTIPQFNLRYFEDRLDASPRVTSSAAERGAQEHTARRLDAERGLKAFAGANTGAVNDPFQGQYNTAGIYGGLLYPLFGSRARERADLFTAEARVQFLSGQTLLSRREELRELRRSYCAYWGSIRQILAAQTYLTAEATVRELLQRRTQAGLLRESDRLEAMSSFDVARREVGTYTAARTAALMNINRIAGTALIDFTPLAPTLPPELADLDAILQQTVTHPELDSLRALVAGRQDTLYYAHHRYPESEVRMTVTGTSNSPGRSGAGALLGIEVRAPVDVFDAHRESKLEGRLMHLQFLKALEHRTQSIQAQAVEMLAYVESRRTNLAFAERRLFAAEQTLREAYLRANVIEGDTLEKMQQARYAYYRVGMDCLSAETDILLARTELLALTGDTSTYPEHRRTSADDASATPALFRLRLLESALFEGVGEGRPMEAVRARADELFAAAPPRKPAARPPDEPQSVAGGIGVYMWMTQAWLNRTLQLAPAYPDKEWPEKAQYLDDPMWKELDDNRVRTVMMSLDGAQIKTFTTDDRAASHLTRMIATAHAKGFRVELLLGEPSWILAAGRQSLLNILQSLRNQPFDGLHLDLEPNQISSAPELTPALLAGLVETLAAAKKISPWEMSLSIHPRYLKEPVGDTTLAGALEKTGVRHVMMMIYVANPQRVVEIAAEAMKASPRLRITVAVSVEPESVVGKGGSMALDGRKRFYEKVWAMDRELRAHANYDGIAVQDWEALRSLKDADDTKAAKKENAKP